MGCKYVRYEIVTDHSNALHVHSGYDMNIRIHRHDWSGGYHSFIVDLAGVSQEVLSRNISP